MNLALLGYGYWGPKLARAAVKAGHSIAWVVDPHWDRIAAASPEYVDAFIGLDPHAAVTDPEVDAVVIATPPETHCALACSALAAGKHVLVTKPMATSTRDAEVMVDAAKRAGRVLMVDHTWLYDERIEWLSAMRPSFVDSIRTNTDGRGGDALWDLLPHDLAILDALGFELDPDRIFAVRAGDSGWMVACNSRPVPSFAWHVAALREFAATHGLSGKRAHIYVDNRADARIRSLVTSAGRVPDEPPPTEPLVRELQHFADVCAGRAVCRTPGEQGLRVVRVIESLARAASTEAAE